MNLEVSIFLDPVHYDGFCEVLQELDKQPRTEEIDYKPFVEKLSGITYNVQQQHPSWMQIHISARDFDHLRGIAKVRSEMGEQAPSEQPKQEQRPSEGAKRGNREKIQSLIPVFNQFYTIANRQSTGDMDWRDATAKVKTIENTLQLIE